MPKIPLELLLSIIKFHNGMFQDLAIPIRVNTVHAVSMALIMYALATAAGLDKTAIP